MPALLTRTSIAADPRRRPSATSCLQLVVRADVADEALGRVRAVDGADLVDHRQHPLGADVDHGDPRALVGEQVGRGPTHARRGAGDDHPLAGDGSGQLGQAGGCGVGAHRRATLDTGADAVPQRGG